MWERGDIRFTIGGIGKTAYLGLIRVYGRKSTGGRFIVSMRELVADWTCVGSETKTKRKPRLFVEPSMDKSLRLPRHLDADKLGTSIRNRLGLGYTLLRAADSLGLRIEVAEEVLRITEKRVAA